MDGRKDAQTGKHRLSILKTENTCLYFFQSNMVKNVICIIWRHITSIYITNNQKNASCYISFINSETEEQLVPFYKIKLHLWVSKMLYFIHLMQALCNVFFYCLAILLIFFICFKEQQNQIRTRGHILNWLKWQPRSIMLNTKMKQYF